MKRTLLGLAARLPSPALTRLRNRLLFDWMNANAPGLKVLNLGSGTGNFDGLLSSEVRMLRMDIDGGKPGIDLVGDALALPFRDSSLDIVYCIAVLEHVRRPWVAAGEITRVLRPGGHVVLELPFLNVIHDEDDYFRFTDRGIRSLFGEDAYETVLAQVGSGGGSFFSVFLHSYFRQFVPTRPLKFLWDVTMRYPLSLCRFLDIPLNRSQELRVTANSFSFIGRKR